MHSVDVTWGNEKLPSDQSETVKRVKMLFGNNCSGKLLHVFTRCWTNNYQLGREFLVLKARKSCYLYENVWIQRGQKKKLPEDLKNTLSNEPSVSVCMMMTTLLLLSEACQQHRLIGQKAHKCNALVIGKTALAVVKRKTVMTAMKKKRVQRVLKWYIKCLPIINGGMHSSFIYIYIYIWRNKSYF